MGKRTLTTVALLAVVLSGCDYASPVPSGFSKALAGTDRIQTTNTHLSSGMAVSGSEVGAITKALSASRKKVLGANMDWNSDRVWELQLFAGSNVITNVSINRNVVRIDHVEYADTSGVTETLWTKLEQHRLR